MKRLLTILLLALIITGCGKNGNSGTAPEKTKADQSQANDMIIEVNDTKKGAYTLPNGKSIDIEATLFLYAVKNGGNKIFGDYKGDWVLTFKTDYKKMSDKDINFAGNVVQDRVCDDLTFSISPYSRKEYDKIRKGAPDGSITLEQLTEMDGMSAFLSNYGTVKWENWKATGSGQVFHQEKSIFIDDELIPIGINILVKGEEVIVDIPTYGSVWKFGFFRGTITKNSDGKKPDDLLSSILSSIGESKKSGASSDGSGGSGNGIYSTGADGSKGFDTNGDGKADTWYDADGNMQSDVIKGSYKTDSQGHMGIDTDGDGKLEMWFDDEGKLYADFDKDGIFEVIEITGSEG